MTASDDLLIDNSEGLALITLNRPKALNALTGLQLAAIDRLLCEFEGDARTRAVAIRGSGRAFSAGGDVRAVYERRGDDAFMHEIYRVEYVLDRRIHRYSKPYLAMMDGIVMGGGCGISVHGSHRVVTENTVFAMPETAIGFFPDIAGTHFLARAPGRIGEYLALTGTRLRGADMLYCGFADIWMPSDRQTTLIEHIRGGREVDAALAERAGDAGAASLPACQDGIDRCFSADSVAEIVEALEGETGTWAEQARAAILAHAPFSQVVTLRALRDAREKSMEDCLTTDFRLALRFMQRDDYFEGVRARIVEKDNAPRWNPATLGDVDVAEVDACFAPLADGDIDFAAN